MSDELFDSLKAENRKTKSNMENLMRRILDKHTRGVFRDENWKPIFAILKDLADEMIQPVLMESKYFTNKDNLSNSPDGKRWFFEIPYQDKGGWYLNIVASFGPSPSSDPTSIYDLVYTLTWSAKIKNATVKKISYLEKKTLP
jgi:hypothetical protein